jgi:hypothetical protein
MVQVYSIYGIFKNLTWYIIRISITDINLKPAQLKKIKKISDIS